MKPKYEAAKEKYYDQLKLKEQRDYEVEFRAQAKARASEASARAATISTKEGERTTEFNKIAGLQSAYEDLADGDAGKADAKKAWDDQQAVVDAADAALKVLRVTQAKAAREDADTDLYM